VKCSSRTSPAGVWTGGDAPDAVDEAIMVFRANVFYRWEECCVAWCVTQLNPIRNFEVKGGGDRILL